MNQNSPFRPQFFEVDSLHIRTSIIVFSTPAPMPECNRPLVRIPTETLFAFRLSPIYAMRLIRAARQYGFELLLRQSLLELQQACFEGFIVLAKKRYFRVLRFDRSR